MRWLAQAVTLSCIVVRVVCYMMHCVGVTAVGAVALAVAAVSTAVAGVVLAVVVHLQLTYSAS